ncbi:helix-turn-helix domain-containing protein [Candidatus Aminicenantes bacterium AC-335-A11]|jgi:cytoskeletal protein RodZ|nr:helix-turn-helix domain-containing protein [SCandidatus Aminicenantes bacterium Aminicenantia_JdfR_composite]MCP2597347.1 helix-turn-helix domain-containing protein [Candidatus Aminicenantes bacterium AC-335-G13]MCP2598113.1 helix-turn-helix domain-containing protein [Candidatus Aminicenantes bacterium AC-335-L06]MCP2618038.1 helix-turn-helix domain-containing protein [Candidatus Aminicenantes bacterium AC-335-A11]
MYNFGEELKKEREARNISLEEISKATKIHINFLRAIEENNFEALPGEFFIKNFIKAYANYLGLDEREVLNRYYQIRPKLNFKSEGALKQIERKNIYFYLKIGLIFLIVLFFAYFIIRSIF